MGRWMVHGVAAAVFALLPAALPSQGQETGTASDLDWLAGAWQGKGPLDYDGEAGAFSVFTDPAEGVVSWTFRWHTPANGHVHFAFTVFEETDAGIVARGIHHGRDYEPFERDAWEFRAREVRERFVRLECVEHCRVRSLTLRLTDDGRLREEYEPLDAAAPLSIFEYRRAR